MKSRSFVVSLDDADLWWLPNGHLECSEDESIWCKHIENALRKNLDAAALWEELEEAPHETLEIEIPLRPTANLWTRISLVNAVMAYPCMEVIFSPVPSTTPHPESYFIGYIHPGEGRMVIRTMMFDWFRGNNSLKKTCTSGSHKYKEEMIWVERMETSLRWVEQWSVYLTGFCMTCNGDDSGGGMTAWADDLVPESTKKESMW